MTDDDLRIGKRRDQPLHVGELGEHGRVEFVLFLHLAEDARRHAGGEAPRNNVFIFSRLSVRHGRA